MDIHKALKWEKKLLKRFYLLMIIISIVLPIAMMLAGVNKLFYVSYLMVIEFLIVIAILVKYNYHYLDYSCNNNKLRVKSGMFGRNYLILCDRVSLVHTEKIEDEMEIVIISNVNLRNKKARLVNKALLKKYPSLTMEYMAQKDFEPEKLFYFQIIKKGGLKKYELLDTIYKNCVKATYTEEAIQNIKISRGQTLV
ncbi:MAG: hypothetical protein ACRC7N_18560 [Clostridium sp.]